MRTFFIFLSFLTMIFANAVSASVKEDVKDGNLLYNNKQYDAAMKKYKSALAKKPSSGIANFDLGTALYKEKSYYNAIESFNKTLASGQADLIEAADYNIGNCQYRIGAAKGSSDIKKVKEQYEMALKYYKRAIDLNPKDKDAKFNYEFVTKRLSELKESNSACIVFILFVTFFTSSVPLYQFPYSWRFPSRCSSPSPDWEH